MLIFQLELDNGSLFPNHYNITIAVYMLHSTLYNECLKYLEKLKE